MAERILIIQPRVLGETLVEFLKLVQRDTRYEVNRWDDMKPFFTELRRYVSRAS